MFASLKNLMAATTLVMMMASLQPSKMAFASPIDSLQPRCSQDSCDESVQQKQHPAAFPAGGPYWPPATGTGPKILPVPDSQASGYSGKMHPSYPSSSLGVPVSQHGSPYWGATPSPLPPKLTSSPNLSHSAPKANGGTHAFLPQSCGTKDISIANMPKSVYSCKPSSIFPGAIQA